MVKYLPAMQETWFDPWVRKILLEKGIATHSCILANFMDRGASWATVPAVIKSQTRLSD